MIAANDNPNGVLQLSAASVTVEEDHTGGIVSVIRDAGDFGQVSLKPKRPNHALWDLSKITELRDYTAVWISFKLKF